MKHIAIINGPNLNLLGKREPHIYGHNTLDDINNNLKAIFQDQVSLTFYQSQHEGYIIDYIHETKAQGIVINAAALTHTSIVIRDALLAKNLPIVEVHLSNIFTRENFRKKSYISNIAIGVITGFGAKGYQWAIEALIDHIT
jgi:3-dehydroquinate dehydratase-2